MQISRNCITVCLNTRFFLLSACAILFLPLKWLLGFLVAVAVHELAHIAVLLLLRGRITSVAIQETGILLSTAMLSRKQEFLVALAGPVGGLLLMLVTYRIPYISVCAFAQSVFNLLPLENFDGGRVLNCVFSKPENGKLYAQIVDHATRTALSVILCYIGFVTAALWIRIAAIAVICRLWHQKYLAKKGNQ